VRAGGHAKWLNLLKFIGWHADCFIAVVELARRTLEQRMQSVVIGMLMPEGSPGAALLVRRSDGQFCFERIDARVACAARAAARWSSKGAAGKDPLVTPSELELTLAMSGCLCSPLWL
jgi:hypothetical protein